MSHFEKYINPPNINRGTRVLHQLKRSGTVVRRVQAVDKNTLREGVPELFYIYGKGFYWVTKDNNQLQYVAHTGSI